MKKSGYFKKWKPRRLLIQNGLLLLYRLDPKGNRLPSPSTFDMSALEMGAPKSEAPRDHKAMRIQFLTSSTSSIERTFEIAVPKTDLKKIELAIAGRYILFCFLRRKTSNEATLDEKR